jgi:hypothetical protein
VFRSSVQAIDQRCYDTLVDISEPLRERLLRHPRLRLEHAADAMRRYALQVPEQYRIGGLQGARGGHHDFMISETRLMPSRLLHDAWDDDEFPEPGVSICKYWFGTKDGKIIHRVQPRVVVSLHALARWFERSGARSHDTLFQDIALLVDASEENEVPCRGGAWLGPTIIADNEGRGVRVRSIRTWVER